MRATPITQLFFELDTSNFHQFKKYIFDFFLNFEKKNWNWKKMKENEKKIVKY